jgi:hypothetical protein
MKRAKLNPQGLARRSSDLMQCIIPDEDHVFISSDLGSAEPTVVTQFSKDQIYADAVFNLSGVDPYWENNILKLSDIYLTVASVNPVTKEKIRKAWDDGLFKPWTVDSELVTSDPLIKPVRALNKTGTLGMLYGMGAKKMASNMTDQGIPLTLEEARLFHRYFWKTFSAIDRFRKYKAEQFKKDGYLINPFGYRLKPSSPHKAFNYFIQSSVSGIINMIMVKLFTVAPWIELVSIIHDELILHIPKSRTDECKSILQSVEDSLNEDLQWDVRMRMGFKPGRTLYEAK